MPSPLRQVNDILSWRVPTNRLIVDAEGDRDCNHMTSKPTPDITISEPSNGEGDAPPVAALANTVESEPQGDPPVPIAKSSRPKDIFTEKQKVDEKVDILRRRLGCKSPLLVKEISDIVQRLSQFETDRWVRLDTKATALLTSAGLSTTIAAGLGSVLGLHASKGHLLWGVVAVALVTLALGFASAFFAVLAMRVKQRGVLDDDAVFNVAVLDEADNPSGIEEADNDKRYEYGLARYREFMIVSEQEVAWATCETNERKATYIKTSQTLFLSFLGLMIGLCLVVSVVAFRR